tara:strand:+ start:676 stop:1575 length:900 start_codon:yes stop_codon:yes gene_type:complete
MATLNEIVYNIKSIANGGNSDTEQDLSSRQVKFWVHYHRAKLLRQLAASGRQLPSICFQNFNPRQNMDYFMQDTDWETYVVANTASTSELLVLSDRTAQLSNYTFTHPVYFNEDFYGRDFFNFDVYEDNDEYGRFIIKYPQLLNINNNFGFKELYLKYGQYSANQNHAPIAVPVVSKDEVINKKFNRFSNAVSPAAYIDMYSDPTGQVLIIQQLRSVFRESVGGYTDPIQYRVYANVCLQNPTELPGWTDDDIYPIPQYLVQDLTQSVLQELQAQLAVPSDRISDNADTAKLVQQKVQR